MGILECSSCDRLDCYNCLQYLDFKAYEEGYEKGYWDAFREERKIVYEKAYREGYKKGYIEGCLKGEEIGFNQSREVDILDNNHMEG